MDDAHIIVIHTIYSFIHHSVSQLGHNIHQFEFVDAIKYNEQFHFLFVDSITFKEMVDKLCAFVNVILHNFTIERGVEI